MQRGFSIVEMLFVVLVVGLVVTGMFVVVSMRHKDTAMNSTPKGTPTLNTTPPQLTHWPVRIDDFNIETRLAGDVYVNDTVLLPAAVQPVVEFGRDRGKNGQAGITKASSMLFLVRPDAPVYAASAGYVSRIEQQQAEGRSDYAVHILPAKADASQWEIVYLYLANVKVRVGDSIQAGKPIGTAAPYGAEQPFSVAALQVVAYTQSNKQGGGEARCPSAFIASDAKRRMTDEFLLLTEAWEAQAASGGIYNESAWTRLGCVADKAAL